MNQEEKKLKPNYDVRLDDIQVPQNNIIIQTNDSYHLPTIPNEP